MTWSSFSLPWFLGMLTATGYSNIFFSLIHGNGVFHIFPFLLRMHLRKPSTSTPGVFLNGPKFIHFYNKNWLLYFLDNQSKGSSNSTLAPNIVWDITNHYKFCEQSGKLKEISPFSISLYSIQALFFFFSVLFHHPWCKSEECVSLLQSGSQGLDPAGGEKAKDY